MGIGKYNAYEWQLKASETTSPPMALCLGVFQVDVVRAGGDWVQLDDDWEILAQAHGA